MMRRLAVGVRRLDTSVVRRSNHPLAAATVVANTSLRHQTGSAQSSSMGDQLKSKGMSMSTPSFGDVSSLGDAPDLGEVETKPASGFKLHDAQGPWIILADELQGELMVEANGQVLFRPGGSLGQGVGKMTLTESTIGATTFKIELETYLYANVAEHPPNKPEKYELVGIIATAKASKQNYTTFTLAGQVQRFNFSTNKWDGLGALNGAKMSPWDPSTAAPKWTPNAEVREAFQQVFSLPLDVSSHVSRAKLASNATGVMPAHMDLSKFKVGDMENVYYIPNYISETEEQQMLAHLNATPEAMKQKLTKRLVQEWGCSMCEECNKSFVPDGNLPPWTEKVNDMLLHDGIFTPSIFPNNVRIHEYEPGEGIAPHVDGPIYVPRVAILSMASTSVMRFYPRQEPHKEPMEHYNDTFKFDGEITKDTPAMSVVLEPRSLLIFQDEAYTHYPHGISDQLVDSLDPAVGGPVTNRHLLSDQMKDVMEVQRQYRVGVTVRNLLPRCNHQTGRTEYAMQRAWDIYNQTQLFPSVALPPAEKPVAASTPVQKKDHPPKVPKTAPAAPTTAATNSPDLAAVQNELRDIRRSQEEILRSIDELKTVVSHTVSTGAAFQKEMSTVMNYLSTTILDVQSKVEDISDELEDQRKD